eukprot:6941248-Ditylum_brightwellii.AAC.1
MSHLEKNDHAEANDGYIGECPRHVKCPGHLTNQDRTKFTGRKQSPQVLGNLEANESQSLASLARSMCLLDLTKECGLSPSFKELNHPEPSCRKAYLHKMSLEVLQGHEVRLKQIPTQLIRACLELGAQGCTQPSKEGQPIHSNRVNSLPQVTDGVNLGTTPTELNFHSNRVKGLNSNRVKSPHNH